MGRNKQNEKAKKDGRHRRETKEEKKERLESIRQAREAFFKTVPYGLGVLVLFLIVFGLYVHSIPPREIVKKSATKESIKVEENIRQLVTERVIQEVHVTPENPDVVVQTAYRHRSRESLQSESSEETLEL